VVDKINPSLKPITKVMNSCKSPEFIRKFIRVYRSSQKFISQTTCLDKSSSGAYLAGARAANEALPAGISCHSSGLGTVQVPLTHCCRQPPALWTVSKLIVAVMLLPMAVVDAAIYIGAK
jgi:hypothetical protein